VILKTGRGGNTGGKLISLLLKNWNEECIIKTPPKYAVISNAPGRLIIFYLE
jgi:hypothetical protein